MLAVSLLGPLRLDAGSVAKIIGAPTGLTNQANPTIYIGGDGVISYRYKLGDGDYSDEIPVDTPISFGADVTILGQQFTAGTLTLQAFLESSEDFISSVTTSNVNVDTPIVFVLNGKRLFLQDDNVLYIEGTNIDELIVYMNNSPGTPAVIVDQSLSSGNGYITYDLKTSTSQTDFVRIVNHSGSTASFRIDLNGMLFASDADVLSAIQAMPPEYPNEPLQRKVWRFIRDNRYHWYGITDHGWDMPSPALFFNSIGFGFCDQSAELYCQFMTSLGYQARRWLFTAHTTSEVLINGRWEMYDADIGVYYYNSQGQVAGVAELATDPSLITNPIDPLPSAPSYCFSQVMADIYSSPGAPYPPWSYGDTNYLLEIQVPPGGSLDLPALFAAPLHTPYRVDVPTYTNARLTIPRNWAGTFSTPFVLHSIGYEGPHTLSVIGKDADGNWQTDPTVVSWTTDSWPPVTTASEEGGEVTLLADEPATIHYTIDGTTPTMGSPVYDGPFPISSTTIVSYFAVDLAGNQESVQYFNPPPVTGVALTMDKSSPQVQGAVVTFTGAATGGSGSYQYYFTYRNPNTGLWSVGQAYSGNPSWVWDTTGATPGVYIVQVWARSAGSTASYEAWAGVYYSIVSPP